MHGARSPAPTIAATRDWTRGSIFRNLISLSWPMMISQSLNMLGPTIDIIWVGRLGTAAIAGVGIAGMIEMLVNSLMMGVVVGLRALIARSVGAGERERAAEVARQAYLLAAAYAVVVAAIGLLFAEPIVKLLGARPEVVAPGATYLRIAFAGSAATAFRYVTEGIMQATGDSVTPMKIAVLYRLLHVVLAPLLIFGLLAFPELGVGGAALSSVIASTLGTVLGLWVLIRGKSRLGMTFRHLRIAPRVIWRIIRIVVPASLMAIERTFGQLLMMRIIVPFGTAAVAAHTVGQRVEMFVLMPTMGISLGAGVLVGQNLGAGQPGRAEKGAWFAIAAAQVVMAVFAVAVLLFAGSIVRVFNSEGEMLILATNFLRIAVAAYPLMAIGALLGQCMSGAGDTLPPMLITLGTWLLQIPLAFALPGLTGLGVYGVRWAMVIGSAAGALGILVYFRTGRWKRKRV